MGLGPWLAWTGEELDNARAVLAWAQAAPGRSAIALRVSSGLGALWRFGAMRDEGVRQLEAALALIDSNVPAAAEARAWRELAWIGVGTRTLLAAERAVLLDASGDDAFALALSRRVLALSLARAGRMVEAEAIVDLADAALRELGLTGSPFYAQVLAMRAISAKEQGRIDEARRLFSDSLAIYVAHGDELLAAVARLNLAELEFAAHDDLRALELVESARSVYRAAGLFSADALAVVNEAAYRLMLGDLAGARLAARDGLAFSLRGQSSGALVPALQVLAAVAALRCDPQRGALLLGFVDAWNASRGYELEATERRTYAAATDSLDAASLSGAERDRLAGAGASLAEAEVIALALEVP
jgi:tetratricopeptide (TPR) repeat protein